MKHLLLPLFSLLFLAAACTEKEDIKSLEPCDEATSIQVVTAFPQSDEFNFESASTDGTCLTVTVSASGCSDEDWSMALVTDGVILESLPTQTNAQLIFDKGSDAGADCQAILTKTYTFDLSSYIDLAAQPSNLTLTGPTNDSRIVSVE